METLTAKSEVGTVEYHLPSIPEAMRLLGKLGLSLDKKSMDELVKNEFEFLAKVMENMGSFVDKIDVKIGNKKVTTFEQFMRETQCLELAMGIAGDILKNIKFSAKKKRPSKKRR